MIFVLKTDILTYNTTTHTAVLRQTRAGIIFFFLSLRDNNFMMCKKKKKEGVMCFPWKYLGPIADTHCTYTILVRTHGINMLPAVWHAFWWAFFFRNFFYFTPWLATHKFQAPFAIIIFYRVRV